MSNLKSWTLGTIEIGKSCGSNTSGSSFHIYIAKLLPLISFGRPSKKSVSLNRNCFCNTSACKPSVASRVTSTNYVDIPLSTNTFITETSHGEEVKIEIFNGNVDNMYVLGYKSNEIIR